jgi:hypothetical protein
MLRKKSNTNKNKTSKKNEIICYFVKIIYKKKENRSVRTFLEKNKKKKFRMKHYESMFRNSYKKKSKKKKKET